MPGRLVGAFPRLRRRGGKAGGQGCERLEESVADSKNLTGVRVMVIDDSNTIRRSAEIFLMQAGCQVILAENGFDALAKIADH